MNSSKLNHYLNNNISDLVVELQKCVEYLPDNNEFSAVRNSLASNIPNLQVYCNLQEISTESFNVYRFIKNEFVSRCRYSKSKKNVRFVVFDGQTMKETNDGQLLDSCFTLDRCLPIIRSVFVNIVDNAIKYMPDETDLVVECFIVGNTKQFFFKNLGPSLDEQEFSRVFDPGYRGVNAQVCVENGQGLGLSQIEPIFQLHTWMDATYSIQSNYEEPIVINGVPYSQFSLVLSFSFSKEKDSLRDSKIAFGCIPNIIFHNVLQIINSSVESINQQLKKKELKCRGELGFTLQNINFLKFNVLFLEYLSVSRIDKNILFGNRVSVSLERYIYSNVKTMNITYSDCIELSGHHPLNPALPTSFYCIFLKFLSLVLESAKKDNDIISIELSSDSIEFIVDNSLGIEHLLRASRSSFEEGAFIFCLEFFNHCNFHCRINKSNILLYV